jgi:hypothetical protein
VRQKSCGGALRGVSASYTDADVDRMRRLLSHFKRDLLWTANGSRIAENILIEAARLYAPSSSSMASVCPFGSKLHTMVDPTAEITQEKNHELPTGLPFGGSAV